MSINSDDLVANLLDHQARVNFALDDGDVNTVIEDLAPLGDTIGAPDSIATTASVGPHKWGDPIAVTAWGFWSWGR